MTTRSSATARRLLARIVLVVVAVLVGVVLVEAALRLLTDRPRVASEWMLTHSARFDSEILFIDGLPSAEEVERVDPELPTLVALGDSFTWGYPVAKGDSYPRVLADMLSRRGAAMNVIEIGMGDSGPDQQLRVFERELLSRLTPDIVVWQFYPNDEWDNVVKAVYGIEDGRLVQLDTSANWLALRQRFYDRVSFSDVLLERSWTFRHLLIQFERRQRSAVPRAFQSTPRAWGLAKIDLAIERMRELAAARGFTAYFVLVAPQALYLDKSRKSDPHLHGFLLTYQRMLALMQHDDAFIHARLPAAKPGSDDTVERFFAHAPRDRLELGARHFNEAGYRDLAATVLHRLAEDGWLDRPRD